MSNRKSLKVYFIHSEKIDYNKLIYLPVLRSNFLSFHKLMFPKSKEYDSVYFKDMISNADLLIIELTNPDAGLNMELKEAIISKKPILALAQRSIGYDVKYQKFLKNVIGYGTEEEFRYFVETFVKTYETRIDEGKVDQTVVLGVLN